MTNALPTDYQAYIHLSRYARWRDDLNRRETWPETVGRYIEFFKGRAADKLPGFDWDDLHNAIETLQVMPSMRCMMTAGKALELDNVAGFNCSYTAVDNIRVFDEILYILMCGTGVGFSVERQYVNKLPALPDTFTDSDRVIVVDDSKIGWATALQELLAALWAGEVPSWDVSAVRPKGARLKTFGGRASGPEPLVELFKFTIHLLRQAAGRKLTSIECHDLVCKIADIVVVGGVRRSALISLSNLSDDRMRHAKSGQWWETTGHRALANNSVAYTEKPEMNAFMREWLALYESKSGERGIFNRVAAQKQAGSNHRRDPNHDFGTNPCCVTGDTMILTSEGHRRIDTIVGQDVKVWNGSQFSDVRPFETGTHPIYRVTLSDGSYLDCTGNHKFATWHGWSANGRREMVEAKDLQVDVKLEKFGMPFVEGGEIHDGDAYSQGFYSGDGNTDLGHSWLYEPKFVCEPRLKGTFTGLATYNGVTRKTWTHGPMKDKRWVPVNARADYCVEWLAGLLDSDGTVTRDENGNGFQITSVDLQFLRDVKLMLTRLGVRAKVVKATDAGMRMMPDGRGGSAEYDCKESHRILIGNTDAHFLLTNAGLKLSRLKPHNGAPQRDARQFVRVVSVEQLGVEALTYCFDEPLEHLGTFNGIVTGQSEIILRSKQFCNLSTVIVRPTDTAADLARKMRYVAILGTLQATLTDFRYLSDEWRKNTVEEALLGTSMTGQMDHPILSDEKNEYLPVLLSQLKEVAILTNREFAAKLGINPATATTCVKPEGTVSQLVDAASGMHRRYAQFYLRTVRNDKKDPLSRLMRDAGVYAEDDVTKPDVNDIFYFPQRSPAGASRDTTALQQLTLWKIYQLHYCEHKPSITVYVKEHEWMEVGAWVYSNFDIVSGVSFLPHNESDTVYKQAPYQQITEAEYHEWVAKMPKDIDWTRIGEYEAGIDTVTGTRDLACSAGVCEIL